MTGQTGRAFHKLLEIFQKVSHYFSNNCSKVAKNNQKLLIATKLTQTVAQKQNLCLVWSYENMQIVQTKVRFLRIFVQFFQRNQRCLITFFRSKGNVMSQKHSLMTFFTRDTRVSRVRICVNHLQCSVKTADLSCALHVPQGRSICLLFFTGNPQIVYKTLWNMEQRLI